MAQCVLGSVNWLRLLFSFLPGPHLARAHLPVVTSWISSSSHLVQVMPCAAKGIHIANPQKCSDSQWSHGPQGGVVAKWGIILNVYYWGGSSVALTCIISSAPWETPIASNMVLDAVFCQEACSQPISMAQSSAQPLKAQWPELPQQKNFRNQWGLVNVDHGTESFHCYACNRHLKSVRESLKKCF